MQFQFNTSKLYFIFLIGVFVFALIMISTAWAETNISVDNYNYSEVNQARQHIKRNIKVKPAKREVKGLYLTAYSASNPKKLNEIVDLIDKTELNSVVIDIKDYTGKILYDSNLLIVNQLKTDQNQLGDVREIVRKLHAKNIYVIARQTVFQDPAVAEKKSEWALKSKSSGRLWRDHKGLAWVDPNNEDVWNYNLAIAKEAIRLGFDEINFDYVRFPTDGNMADVAYTNSGQKFEVMKKFFNFLGEKLKNEKAWISIDTFGLTMERNDDMDIGQRIVDAVANVDYICPMMYPSHYGSGHLGLQNPAEFPGLVFENGMKKGMPKFENKRAKARPWIQAFNIGAVYDGAKIREQIDMIEKYSDGGWLMWNAANRYTSDGLKNND